jgi:hypothetical protein
MRASNRENWEGANEQLGYFLKVLADEGYPDATPKPTCPPPRGFCNDGSIASEPRWWAGSTVP